MGQDTPVKVRARLLLAASRLATWEMAGERVRTLAPLLNKNLIVNGDAEMGQGSPFTMRFLLRSGASVLTRSPAISHVANLEAASNSLARTFTGVSCPIARAASIHWCASLTGGHC